MTTKKSGPGWRNQLIMATALLGLGTLALWNEYKRKPERESVEEQTKKVLDLKDKQISEFGVRDGTQTIQVRCVDLKEKLCRPGDNARWELTAPLQIRADDATANQLVSAINNLAPSQTLSLKDDAPEKRASLLKEFGLDPASLQDAKTKRVSVVADGAEWALYLGITHPGGDALYAAVEKVPAGQKPSGAIQDDRVFMIPTFFTGNLGTQLARWRDKRIATFAAANVESFEYFGPGNQAISGKRGADGRWTLEPGKLPGDAEAIESLLTTASYLTATDFAYSSKHDPAAKLLLKNAKTTLQLTVHLDPAKSQAKDAAQPITLAFYRKDALKQKLGQQATDVLATNSTMDPLFSLSLGAIERLILQPKSLRLSKLFGAMERFNSRKIELTGAGFGTATVSVKGDGAHWKTDDGKGTTVDEKAQALLDQLVSNRVQDFIPNDKAPPGEKQALRLRILGDGDQVLAHWALWKDGAALYARDLGATARKELLRVDSGLASALPWGPDFFTPAKH